MTKPNGAISDWSTNVDPCEVNWLLQAFERACTSLLAETNLNRGQFVIDDEEIRDAMVKSKAYSMHLLRDYHAQ